MWGLNKRERMTEMRESQAGGQVLLFEQLVVVLDEQHEGLCVQVVYAGHSNTAGGNPYSTYYIFPLRWRQLGDRLFV